MNQKLIAGIAVAVVLIGGILYFTSQQPSTVPVETGTSPSVVSNTSPASNLQKSKTASSTKPVLKSKPGTQATITNAVLSKTISASGAPLNPTTTFSPSAPTIYATLTLKNAVQRTELSYIRYYKGKYVDTKVSHPTRDGVKNFYFKFSLKPGKTRTAGPYTLIFYVNGKKAQSVNYTVR